jgi:hypothetical protein
MMKRPNQRSIIQSYQISTISTCYGAVRTGRATAGLGPILKFETLGSASRIARPGLRNFGHSTGRIAAARRIESCGSHWTDKKRHERRPQIRISGSGPCFAGHPTRPESDGLFLRQPALVRPHFASIVRQCLGCRAVGRPAKPAGQRQRLEGQASLDLFFDHPACFRFTSSRAGGKLCRAKGDDSRCLKGQRPGVKAGAKPGISRHHRLPATPLDHGIDRIKASFLRIISSRPDAFATSREPLRPSQKARNPPSRCRRKQYNNPDRNAG